MLISSHLRGSYHKLFEFDDPPARISLEVT